MDDRWILIVLIAVVIFLGGVVVGVSWGIPKRRL